LRHDMEGKTKKRYMSLKTLSREGP
jgi:hypothetical protein